MIISILKIVRRVSRSSLGVKSILKMPGHEPGTSGLIFFYNGSFADMSKFFFWRSTRGQTFAVIFQIVRPPQVILTCKRISLLARSAVRLFRLEFSNFFTTLFNFPLLIYKLSFICYSK